MSCHIIPWAGAMVMAVAVVTGVRIASSRMPTSCELLSCSRSAYEVLAGQTCRTSADSETLRMQE